MENKKQAYIFIGRSGCGKGTQAKLLIENLKKEGRKVFALETGNKFREFTQGEKYSNQLSRKIAETGGLQPDFLAILMWASAMTDSVSGDEDFVIDGSPRKMAEAIVLDSVFKFYGFIKPVIVFLNVSRQWSEDRLLGRGRNDDDADEIKKRLDWFDTDVMPVLEWYKNNENYNFVEINGEQTIEEVYREIIKKLDA
ncbi:MAG: nucleoside monophosphate kinase [Patescibacteria group bacterium]